ncbi:hypothetical protein GCM10025760_19320 [Microbacterium yannicii]|uniref:Transcriptional regulator, AbiEi antitoxin, Type IV TA system n=1 Tax=Microbacterium yannicii TaxID=671622 RepID=A0ABP9M5V1_9MICO|nr:hypothetical protein [Microbacterium yannicii]
MPLIAVSTIVRPSPVPLIRWTDAPHPERGVAKGVLVRVRHGVYASARLWQALAPWDRYLAHVHAVALMLPDVVFCCESAAALLGMPVFGDPVVVHLLVESSGTSRLAAGVRSHRAADDRMIIEASGLALTSPADTAIDLARHRHPAIGRSTADAALRADPALTRELLVSGNETRTSSRGRNIARWSLSRGTARAETPLESVSLCVIEWLGFPEPELQVSFPSDSGEVDRGDMLWRSLGVLGEADGDLKYDGRFGDAATVLRRQHLRDRRLRSHAEVNSIVHWGWGDASSVTPLQQILLGAGMRPIAPEQSVPLHSLKRELSARAPHRQIARSESARVQPADEV